MIDVDLRKEIITSAGVLAVLPNAASAGVVQQNKIDQGAGTNRIWYVRADDVAELFTNGDSALTTTRFDVECMSDDIDTVQTIAQAIKDTLHGFRGILGDSSRVKLITVATQAEEYKPVNDSADDGLHIVALLVEITHD